MRENLTLPLLAMLRRWGLVATDKVRDLSDSLIERFGIVVARPDAPARLLSGGNQQKVAVAKWLASESKILILDEPTRGIDVGAKQEIYELINQLTQEGLGIIMISSELPEVIGMSDRVVVMREGKIMGVLNHDELNEEVIMSFAMGG